MITQLQYMKALKIVLNYQDQLEMVKSGSEVTTIFKLENYFRSDAIRAIHNCYHDTFGIYKEYISLEDLCQLDIKKLYRFRGFGQKAELKLKELMSHYIKNNIKKQKGTTQRLLPPRPRLT